MSLAYSFGLTYLLVPTFIQNEHCDLLIFLNLNKKMLNANCSKCAKSSSEKNLYVIFVLLIKIDLKYVMVTVLVMRIRMLAEKNKNIFLFTTTGNYTYANPGSFKNLLVRKLRQLL